MCKCACACAVCGAAGCMAERCRGDAFEFWLASALAEERPAGEQVLLLVHIFA